MTVLNRRKFLKSGGLLAGAGAAIPALGPAMGQFGAGSQAFGASNQLDLADLRGSLANEHNGLIPGAADDQSKLFQSILDRAAESNKPVFLPAGVYFISNINLPKNTKLLGVPGLTRLVFGGGGHFIMAENADHIELDSIAFDGVNKTLADYAEAALRVNNCDNLVINNCEFLGSQGAGIQTENCGGRIENCTVRGAAGTSAMYLVGSKGMRVSGNVVSDCLNGGILVHRWEQGEDGTIVTNNRIQRIGAGNGGTGQWGNGINVFRAGSVIINNNQISDCAFSAIRSNSGDNVQINNNTCNRSGETAIYSEFEFVGAVINSNVVDGGTRGISIANFMQGGRMAVCANNLIRNIHENAPYKDDDHPFGDGINAEADTTVTGNVIENAKRWGISLGWGPYLRDVVVSSNVVRESGMGVCLSVVEGVGKVLIADNIFSGMKKGAIVGHRWKEAVTGDLAVDGSGDYQNLTIERNLVS